MWMLGSEGLLDNRQRALIERLGLRIVALGSIELPERAGTSPWWFYLATVASLLTLYGHRFGLPEAVALHLVPSSAAARPFLLTQLGLSFLSAGGGLGTHVGVLDALDTPIPISLMAIVQLSGAWFLFRWWRAV